MKHTFLRLNFIVLAVLLGGLVTQTAQAQITTGTILGTVTDSSGSVLPRVVVRVVNLEQGLQRQVTTNEQESFPDLPLGGFRLTAQAKSFDTFVRQGLELHVQDKVRVDLSMTVGSMSETVAGSATLVRIEDATQANVINNQSIVDLP